VLLSLSLFIDLSSDRSSSYHCDDFFLFNSYDLFKFSKFNLLNLLNSFISKFKFFELLDISDKSDLSDKLELKDSYHSDV
jgi:hypothetical protein